MMAALYFKLLKAQVDLDEAPSPFTYLQGNRL